MTIMDVPAPAAEDLQPAEIGHPGGLQPSWHHHLGPGYIASGYEDNPELEFPRSAAVYDSMRRTDGQVGALLRAITLPILSTGWKLDSTGVRPEVTRFVETELGIGNLDRTRRRRGVVWKEHLRTLLLALPLGFMPFEKVYQVGPPTAEQLAAGGDWPDLVAHLVNLSPRLPRTIQEIRVHRNGDLAGIIQAGIGWDTSGQGSGVQVVGGPGFNDDSETWIPEHALAYYCFEREGADWTGSSILRNSYKHWLIKDQLIRTDAIAGERNGMGIPMVYYSDQGNKAEALAIAQSIRAGAYAGGAAEDGAYKVELLTPQGQVRDLLPSIKYHDQAATRSALAMFLDLGHDNGARALGDTFVDYFVQSLRVSAEWAGDTTTTEVIRDLVDNTFGMDEPAPVLVADEISAESTPTAEALKTLVDAGILTPDHELEVETRRRYGLPAPQAITVTGGPGDDDSPTTLDPQADPHPFDLPDGAAPTDDYLARVERALTRIAQLRAAGS